MKGFVTILIFNDIFKYWLATPGYNIWALLVVVSGSAADEGHPMEDYLINECLINLEIFKLSI